MAYPTLNGKPIVPLADLQDMQSDANRRGDTRHRYEAMGKRAGMLIWVMLSGAVADSNFMLAFATGDAPEAAWRAGDGSASYTPANLGSWTVSDGCTYSNGLLTADGTDDPTATQDVELSAGRYMVSGTAAYEGSESDYDAPKLVITGAEDGELLSKVFTGARHATAAENADPKEAFSYTFELTEAQTVTFEISNVNEAGSLEAGSSYIVLNPLTTI